MDFLDGILFTPQVLIEIRRLRMFFQDFGPHTTFWTWKNTQIMVKKNVHFLGVAGGAPPSILLQRRVHDLGKIRDEKNKRVFRAFQGLLYAPRIFSYNFEP